MNSASPRRTTAGLVLAGGESRRMGGGHKFLLDLAGRPLIAHVADRLAPQVAALAISANCDPALLPPGHRVLPDAPPSRGPLSGLHAGLLWAARTGGMTHLATAAADTPFLPRDLVAALAAASPDGRPALAASAGRVHPTFGLWPVTALPALEAWLAGENAARMRDFASACGAVTVDFPTAAGDPFFNVNDPGDLEAARRLAGASSPAAGI